MRQNAISALGSKNIKVKGILFCARMIFRVWEEKNLSRELAYLLFLGSL